MFEKLHKPRGPISGEASLVPMYPTEGWNIAYTAAGLPSLIDGIKRHQNIERNRERVMNAVFQVPDHLRQSFVVTGRILHATDPEGGGQTEEYTGSREAVHLPGAIHDIEVRERDAAQLSKRVARVLHPDVQDRIVDSIFTTEERDELYKKAVNAGKKGDINGVQDTFLAVFPSYYGVVVNEAMASGTPLTEVVEANPNMVDDINYATYIQGLRDSSVDPMVMMLQDDELVEDLISVSKAKTDEKAKPQSFIFLSTAAAALEDYAERSGYDEASVVRLRLIKLYTRVLASPVEGTNEAIDKLLATLPSQLLEVAGKVLDNRIDTEELDAINEELHEVSTNSTERQFQRNLQFQERYQAYSGRNGREVIRQSRPPENYSDREVTRLKNFDIDTRSIDLDDGMQDLHKTPRTSESNTEPGSRTNRLYLQGHEEFDLGDSIFINSVRPEKREKKDESPPKIVFRTEDYDY